MHLSFIQLSPLSGQRFLQIFYFMGKITTSNKRLPLREAHWHLFIVDEYL